MRKAQAGVVPSQTPLRAVGNSKDLGRPSLPGPAWCQALRPHPARWPAIPSLGAPPRPPRECAGLCTPAGLRGPGHNRCSSASLPGPPPLPPPPEVLWSPWERASGLTSNSVWLYSVRRAIFSSLWLYFFLMAFWTRAQAGSKALGGGGQQDSMFVGRKPWR